MTNGAINPVNKRASSFIYRAKTTIPKSPEGEMCYFLVVEIALCSFSVTRSIFLPTRLLGNKSAKRSKTNWSIHRLFSSINPVPTVS